MGQYDQEWGTLIIPLVDWKEEWWVVVMGVGLDPVLSKMVHAFGYGYYPNWEGI